MGLFLRWFYVQELPKAQPAVVLVLKRLRRWGNGLKSHPTDGEKPGIEPATPGLQDIGLSLHHGGFSKKKLFVAFPWVETSTGPGGFMICVFINMTGTPKGSTESGFMEKPGIEPATPGLQGIALIHYTMGASHGGFSKNFLWLFHG